MNGFIARMDDIIEGEEPQGLFSKRSSSNILSDPRILAHLRIVAEEAQSSDKDHEQDEESELQNTKRELGLKIAAYNKGNQHGAFRLILKEVRGELNVVTNDVYWRRNVCLYLNNIYMIIINVQHAILLVSCSEM